MPGLFGEAFLFSGKSDKHACKDLKGNKNNEAKRRHFIDPLSWKGADHANNLSESTECIK
jgi:hypothetical protein